MCPMSNSAETTSGASSRTLPGMQNLTHSMQHFELSIMLNFYQSINHFGALELMFTGLAAC